MTSRQDLFRSSNCEHTEDRGRVGDSHVERWAKIGLALTTIVCGLILAAALREPAAHAQVEPGTPPPNLGVTAVHDREHQDPGMQVLEDLILGNYQYQYQVTSGRFLDRFRHYDLLLSHVDTNQLITDPDTIQVGSIRRGKGWVSFEVPYGTEPTPVRARIRLTNDAGTWKVEHIRVPRQYDPDPRTGGRL